MLKENKIDFKYGEQNCRARVKNALCLCFLRNCKYKMKCIGRTVLKITATEFAISTIVLGNSYNSNCYGCNSTCNRYNGTC